MASLLAATHPARCIGRRRLGSSSVATRGFHRTAQDAADELMGAFGGKTVSRRQLIDGNQLQKLALTLGRPRLAAGQGHGHGQGGADDLVVDVSDAAPPTGTPVPPGHHLVYFTPGGLEAQLGMDGTDTAYNAPSPFTRRMWAGGVMRWPGAGRGDTGLRVGDEAEERTRLLSATPKKSRSAGEMILVEVEKEFWTARGLAVVDRRSWVFRPTLDAGAGTGAAPPPPGLAIERDAREPSRVADVDDGHALTFNGHKIHLDEAWARNVEGHAGLVVHGPLNLICMLDYWRDVHGRGQGQLRLPEQMSYRAMTPVYAGETYHVVTRGEADGAWDLVVDRNGTSCMKGEVLCGR